MDSKEYVAIFFQKKKEYVANGKQRKKKVNMIFRCLVAFSSFSVSKKWEKLKKKKHKLNIIIYEKYSQVSGMSEA